MASKTVLITGANRGIGLELAKAHANDGWHVLATARDPKAASELEQVVGADNILPLDVKEAASVAALAEKLNAYTLDRLINNAGVFGPRVGYDAVDYDAWLDTLNVNTLGPLRVSLALDSHLSGEAGVFAISSRMGSIAQNKGGAPIYRSSKTALNMAYSCLANDWSDSQRCVAVFHPGWVQTDMGGPGADITPQQSASDLFKTMNGLGREHSGGFFNHDGSTIEF